jgi:uncharacterized protein with FMN-binding domain
MRRAIAASIGALALGVSNAGAWAAVATHTAAAKVKLVTATKSFTGAYGSAGRWGDLEVTIVVKKTTTTNLTTKKKTVKRKITSVSVPVYPNHTNRSIYINQQALPLLVQETIQAQSASVDMISRATDTSDAFQQSLQSAVLKAKGW